MTAANPRVVDSEACYQARDERRNNKDRLSIINP